MDQITLDDPEHLHKIFRAYRSHMGFASWFRGQADIKWPLLPKAGRDEFFLPDHRDLGRLKHWRDQAIAYTELPDSEIECMAIAQHQSKKGKKGVKSPLDCTFLMLYNPLHGTTSTNRIFRRMVSCNESRSKP